MCLIVFANKVHKNYKLIFAANRDEFYERSAEDAGFWKDHPELLAGKDLQACGTWMGITKQGKFAAITNYRDPKNFNNNAQSRGLLTYNFLTNGLTAPDYYLTIKKDLQNYNGFNLIIGNADDLNYLSSVKGELQKIEPGIHGLSNSFLDTPWPKVEKSKERLKRMIEKDEINSNELMSLLTDTAYAKDDELPDTGVGLELERVLSSVFIKSPKYGTRCSTVLLIDTNNNVGFVEKTYLLSEERFTTKEFNFKIEEKIL
jgi:uncharacterized protein with NRDE domain